MIHPREVREMRYCRVRDPQGEIHLGAYASENQFYYLDELFPKLNGKTLLDFIRMVNGDTDEARSRILEKAATATAHSIEGEELQLLAPIEHTVHDILCVGVNYRDHLEETKEHMAGAVSDEVSDTVYFAKRAHRILGPDEPVHGRDDLDEKIDYEVELAVLIGKEGKNISEEDAENYIFGYSVFNDLSSRALQTSHGQWLIGKSLDEYTSRGPVIVDRQELPMPLELVVRSYVNGELRQNSNTRNLIKNVPAIIAELSQGITLEVGDIIATGTPSGVGMGFVPPRFLKKGDQVCCEVEHIGQLINKIV